MIMVGTELVCQSCGVVTERIGSNQHLCPTCSVVAAKARKAAWSKRRNQERREGVGQLTLDDGFIVKQKRRVPLSSTCLKCGVVFSYGAKIKRDYCSRECWYKKGTLKNGNKVCPVCREEKAPNLFSKSKSTCKACTSDKVIEYMRGLKEKSSIEFLCLRASQSFCAGLGGQAAMRVALVEKLTLALGKTCPYCAVELTLSNFSFDHIKPKSRGGAYNDASNVHVTCLRCNSMKGNIGHEAFIATLGFIKYLGEDERKIIEARLLSGNSRFTRKA